MSVRNVLDPNDFMVVEVLSSGNASKQASSRPSTGATTIPIPPDTQVHLTLDMGTKTAPDKGVTQGPSKPPQVIVVCRGSSCAFGRQAIINAGKEDFMEWLFGTFVWTRPRPKMGYCSAYYDATFPNRATLLATFYTTPEGLGHSEPVKIGSHGWEEMVPNVVQFELVYEG